MTRTSQLKNDRGDLSASVILWVALVCSMFFLGMYVGASKYEPDGSSGTNDEPSKVTQSQAPKTDKVPNKAMPTAGSEQPQKPNKKSANSGVCARRDLGEYPKIALRLLKDRTIPGWSNSYGEDCVDAEAWSQLIDDSRAVARERADKRLDKVVAAADTSWVGKLDVVTQWACDGNAAKSQEWAAADDAYTHYWRVSIEHDVPDDLLEAVERYCPYVGYYLEDIPWSDN